MDTHLNYHQPIVSIQCCKYPENPSVNPGYQTGFTMYSLEREARQQTKRSSTY